MKSNVISKTETCLQLSEQYVTVDLIRMQVTYLVLTVDSTASVTQHLTDLDGQAVPRHNMHHGITTL